MSGKKSPHVARPVLLVFPPVWDDESPYPALPLLSGFLRKHGVDVIQRDLNSEWRTEHLTDAHLWKLSEYLRERLADGELDGPVREHLADAYTLIPCLAGRIDEAIRHLKEWNHDVVDLNHAGRLLTAAWQVCQSPYYPTYNQTTQTYSDRYEVSRLLPVLEAAKSRGDNPFVEWYESQVRDLLSRTGFRLAGICLTGEFQVVPGFTLARVIKRLAPEVPVVIGGALLPYMRAALLKMREAFDWVDYYVVGEGETSLLELCRHLAGETKRSAVPNLIYFEQSAQTIKANDTAIEDVNQLATLDLCGLDLATYRAPSSLWIQTSRGCYWDRCAFCSLCLSMANTYRERDMKLVLDDIGYLIKTHRLGILKFADECVSVDRLAGLVQGLEERGLAGTFKYFLLLRFDDRLDRNLLERAYRSGLRYVSWGLESVHPDTLRLMRKGITPQTAERCLRDSHACGIWNTVFGIAEFPGAPEDDAQRTISFFVRNQEYIDFMDYTSFRLETGSEVYKHPDKYGIVVPAPAEDYICPRHEFRDLRRNRTVGRTPDVSEESRSIYMREVHTKPTHMTSQSHCFLSIEQLISRLDNGLTGKLELRAEIQRAVETVLAPKLNAEEIASMTLRVPKGLQSRVSDSSAAFSRRVALYNDRTAMCSIVNTGVLQILRRVGDGKPFAQLVDEIVTQANCIDRSVVEVEVAQACQDLVVYGHLEAERV